MMAEEKFRYYMVWQRRGNFSLGDSTLNLTQPIESEDGIVEAKQTISREQGAGSSRDYILLNWKRID